MENGVTFVMEADVEGNNKIDDEYLRKYERFPQYVAPLVAPEVPSTSLKLMPRSKHA